MMLMEEEEEGAAEWMGRAKEKRERDRESQRQDRIPGK